MSCITLLTRGGTDITPAGLEYTSEVVGDQFAIYLSGRAVQAAEQAGRGASYGGATWTPFEFEVQHVLAGNYVTMDATWWAALNKLQKEHYRPDLGPSTLVFTLNGVDMRVTVGPPKLRPLQDDARQVVRGVWTILDIVRLGDSTSSSTATNMTGSPHTHSVANAGTSPSTSALLVLTGNTAKTAANGQRFRRYITPLWRAPRAARGRPVDLADSFGMTGWDHAAEVTATRSQADGDDVELYVNGKRAPRWTWASGAGGWNQTTTRLWTNLYHPPARYWTYTSTGTLSTGATSVTCKEEFEAMPAVPFVAIFDDSNAGGRDVVIVTAYNANTKTLTVTRNARGTTASVAHAVGTKLYHCPILIDLVYGWTSAPAQTYVDDNYKPMFLESVPGTLSDNGYWNWLEFQEAAKSSVTQDRKPRSATWYTEAKAPYDRERLTGQGDMYCRWIPRTATLSTDANVCTKMCIAYNGDGPTSGHPLMDRWTYNSEIGITELTFTYVVSTVAMSVPYEGRLEVRGIDEDGNDLLLGSYSAAAATVTITLAVPVYTVSFVIHPFDPKVDGSSSVLAANEPTDADGFTIDDVKFTFSTTEEPLFVWGASPAGTANIYQFGRPEPETPGTIADADGRSLNVHGLLVPISGTMTLNLDTYNVYDASGLSYAGVTSGEAPHIPPGTNDLTLTDSGTGGGSRVDAQVTTLRAAWS